MRCLKCDGCLHFEQDDWGGPYLPRCLNCGARPLDMLRPGDPERHKYGAQLPKVMEVKQP